MNFHYILLFHFITGCAITTVEGVKKYENKVKNEAMKVSNKRYKKKSCVNLVKKSKTLEKYLKTLKEKIDSRPFYHVMYLEKNKKQKRKKYLLHVHLEAINMAFPTCTDNDSNGSRIIRNKNNIDINNQK